MIKYNHIGIPTAEKFEGEIDLPHLKMTVSDYLNNPFGIQWQRYWAGAPYPDLVKSVPHVAFEVDDLAAAIEGQKILIAPNSPSEGLIVAFIEVNGAPVELMHYDKEGPTYQSTGPAQKVAIPGLFIVTLLVKTPAFRRERLQSLRTLKCQPVRILDHHDRVQQRQPHGFSPPLSLSVDYEISIPGLAR